MDNHWSAKPGILDHDQLGAQILKLSIMSLTSIILICIAVYLVIAVIVYLCTKDFCRSIFWIFYLLDEIDFDDFDFD